MPTMSPRGSISGSSDVALDFEDSLKDLSRNDRYEIGNLTTIARESTEHAKEISRVLEKHIRTTAPSKKLPALYVLDSIIKNVGTPYTVYLSANLYTTFMEAYTLVDSGTRRAMDSLLKTWKEPVPGSLDHQPVLPPEVVRPIENALIKAKTAALQNQRQAPPSGFQPTPTPPQFQPQHMIPPMPASVYQAPQQAYGIQQPAVPQQPWPGTYASPPSQQPLSSMPVASPSLPSVDVNALKADINNLVSRVREQFAASPMDHALMTQLQALLQLKQIIDAGAVPESLLQDVRQKVTALALAAPQPSVSTTLRHDQTSWPPAQAYQPPSTYLQTYQPTPVAPPASSYPPPAAVLPQQSSVPYLGPNAIDGLQALLANGQKPSTPQMRSAVPELQHMPHAQLHNVQSNVAAAPTNNPADLLAALSKSGVLASLVPPAVSQPAPVPITTAPAPAPNSTAALLASLPSILPPSHTGTPRLPLAQPSATTTTPPKIPFTNAALKPFRPELVRALYDDQPNQCSTCGRRFLATDEGRQKKDRHLDWHFRTNQRLADPNASRGQHRQWYVDEVEWINLGEFDVSTASAADAAAAAAGGTGTNGASAAGAGRNEKGGRVKSAKEHFLRAPAGVTKLTCPICQEEMRSSYSEELQDWVFTNATYYNGKPAHASCVEEMRKPYASGAGGGGNALAAVLAAAAGGAQQRQRSATPESTGSGSALGKRKAEGVLAGVGARLKTG